MLSRRFLVSACAAAMFTAVNVASAIAQQPIDSRTEFTFRTPVELPGTTLPPGTYVFRFADATTSKTVMQVADKASNKTYGLFLTISAQRPKASDDAELRFLETPAGTPAAVKTWWYPGNTIGREFIYPKAQARRLAMATNTTVLTTKEENVTSDNMKTAELEYVEPSGKESAVTERAEQTVAANTAPAPNMDRTPVRESQSASNTSNRRRLPRTDSTLPMLLLMGVTSLAGGASLRFRR
ncbi:MAG TPA: hypothetical protein VGZ27_18370 [Vicinamibacterales bacterium]|nr:hypothetical protein [Vicinamibacterales bacterium]